jgi:CRP/FNR family transcriptional regulator
MESPELGARFLQRLAGELGKAEEGQFRSTHQRIRTRLAYLILSLKGAHGDVDDEGNILIESPLSRQDMAAVIGARPESLSRAIRALQDDGVVVFDRRRIIIEDLDNLLDEIDHHI